MAERTSVDRSKTHAEPVRVRFDRFELDQTNARLLRDGSPLTLAPTPFAVLCALARNPGALLTKQSLLDEVWGHQFVSESVLKTVISELRTTLHDDARKPRFIETVSRRGYRFIATTTPAARSLPGAAPGGSGPGLFIGRADALTRLHGAWDRACTGRRAIVWVAGEPGIGKTTLIEHFLATLGDAVVARGQCVEHYGAGEPYLPVLEALSALCRTDATLVALLRSVAPTWLLQLPWLSTAEEREALRRDLAGVSPDRMLREMGELLDRAGELRPLLLVTEDLHWSDRATIQLIDYVARRRGDARLMWLASFRLAEVVALDHPLNALRHELRLHGLADEIVLEPFSENEVAAYVAERSPSIATDEAFVRALHERTDGLPLFVASIVNEVVADRVPAAEDADTATPLANIAIPENLARIIDHYIAKLSRDQRSVLTAAAVCGVDFRISTVAAVLDRDPAWVGEVCEELVREQLWLVAPHAAVPLDGPEPPHSFKHALFRQMMYERTTASARNDLHRKTGVVLARDRAAGAPVTAAELAAHFDRGRDPIAALHHYVEAAKQALEHLLPSQCLALTERALHLLQRTPESAERTTLEISLLTLRGVGAMHVLGIGVGAKAALERAYALLSDVPDHPMRGRLLQGLAFVASLSGDYPGALAVAERAEALAAMTSDPVLTLAACIARGEVDQLQGRPGVAMTWIERGLAIGEARDQPLGEVFIADPLVTLGGLLGIQLVHTGRVREARERLQWAHERARRLAHPMSRLVATWFEALLEVRLGDAHRVATLADDMRALVEEFDLAHGRAGWRWFAGWAEARAGRAREGYCRIREAYEENTRLGMLAGSTEVLGYAVEALVLAGDPDLAERELQEALRDARSRGERVYLPQLFMLEAAIARARGQSAGADASIRRALGEAREQESPWLQLAALLDLCEHGAPKAADRKALVALVAQLAEARDTTAVARARALLGQNDRD